MTSCFSPVLTTLGRRWMLLTDRLTCSPVSEDLLFHVQRILWSFLISSIRAVSYFASTFCSRLFRSKWALNPQRKNIEWLFMFQKIIKLLFHPLAECCLNPLIDAGRVSVLRCVWSVASFIAKPVQWLFFPPILYGFFFLLYHTFCKNYFSVGFSFISSFIFLL